MTRPALAIAELLLGVLTGLVVWEMVAAMLGMGEPIWDARSFGYLGWLFGGPALLVVGSVLTLIRVTEKAAAILLMGGSAVLASFGLYFASSVVEEWSRPVADRAIAFVVLAMTLASPFAAYKLYRLASGPRATVEQKPSRPGP